jgi:hypothetical protein
VSSLDGFHLLGWLVKGVDSLLFESHPEFFSGEDPHSFLSHNEMVDSIATFGGDIFCLCNGGGIFVLLLWVFICLYCVRQCVIGGEYLCVSLFGWFVTGGMFDLVYEVVWL